MESSPRRLQELDSKLTSSSIEQSEPPLEPLLQCTKQLTTPEPIPFEFAPGFSPSSKPKQRMFQQKILRQQRLLFDLVEDLCRRVDDGMISIKARLTSLEAATELLEQQQRSFPMETSSLASNNKIWMKCAELLEQDNVSDALKICCESGDDSTLIRLLGRLSIETSVEADLWPLLMTRFSVLIGRNLFVDNVSTWILKALREEVHIPLIVRNAIKQAQLQSDLSPSILTLSRKLDLSLESSS